MGRNEGDHCCCKFVHVTIPSVVWVVEGNCLSPFARHFDTPSDLNRRQKPDKRGRGALVEEDEMGDEELEDESKSGGDSNVDEGVRYGLSKSFFCE